MKRKQKTNEQIITMSHLLFACFVALEKNFTHLETLPLPVKGYEF